MKPIPQRGKVARLWEKTRIAWIKANPPDHQGYYVCGICGRAVHYTDMELDHIEARSGSPMSIADFSNLQPAHSYCNRMKGSRHMTPKVSKADYEFRKKLNL